MSALSSTTSLSAAFACAVGPRLGRTVGVLVGHDEGVRPAPGHSRLSIRLNHGQLGPCRRGARPRGRPAGAPGRRGARPRTRSRPRGCSTHYTRAPRAARPAPTPARGRCRCPRAVRARALSIAVEAVEDAAPGRRGAMPMPVSRDRQHGGVLGLDDSRTRDRALERVLQRVRDEVEHDASPTCRGSTYDVVPRSRRSRRRARARPARPPRGTRSASSLVSAREVDGWNDALQPARLEAREVQQRVDELAAAGAPLRWITDSSRAASASRARRRRVAQRPPAGP